MGVPNPGALPPGTNPLTAIPFGDSPNPFNNSAWAPVLRVVAIPPLTTVIPMQAAQPGSLPPTIEAQQVTLPGYLVTEMTTGYLVHGHWGVRPVGNAYYWTYFPTNFVRK